jgi:3-dehydroquinate synthase
MSQLRSITVETVPAYPVHIGPGALTAHSELVSSASALVADERVHGLHGGLIQGAQLPTHLLPEGEQAKSLKELERALEFLCDEQLDRDSTLLVLGGGAATDLGGLAASLYLRGVSWIACPTTLLAMVDASVGGKTAVNLKSGKNLAGSFHQPAAVIADTDTLQTLSGAEYTSGLGELLKTALIDGEGFLSFLEAEQSGLLARESDIIAEAVQRSVATKARIVASDPNEAGPRKALNLGHTFAHAIEQAAGPGLLPHGIAVAVGCALALKASEDTGLLIDPELPKRFARLAAALGLPTQLTTLREATSLKLSPEELFSAMSHDKKSSAGAPRFVLPRCAGDIALDVELDPLALLA